MNQSESHILKWAVLPYLLLLTACASSPKLLSPPSSSVSSPEVDEPIYIETSVPNETLSSPPAEIMLREEVAEWVGTPFVYGGTNQTGLDCSAFVKTLYKDLFDLTIPRTTAQQVQLGFDVPLDELRAGDLVFFLPPSKSRHVGICLNRREFAHASTSQGVTISQLSDQYWRNSYWTSRRIIPDTHPIWALTEAPNSAAIEQHPQEQQRTRRRIGW